MTYIGSPMIYYGAEAGMWGADDPDNRKPMVWPDLVYDNETSPHDSGISYTVEFDYDLFNYHKKLISIRKQSKAIRFGSFKPLYLSHPNRRLLCYERQFEEDKVIVILNASEKPACVALDFLTGKWKDEITGKIFQAASMSMPKIQLTLDSHSGAVLRKLSSN
jgi:Glycosidases